VTYHPPASRRFAKLLMLANVMFWLIFAGGFAFKSYPYKPHQPFFEERSPELIYFGRALSYLENERLTPFMRVTFTVQKPSFYAASPLNFYFSRKGIVVDQLYGGISAGGYYLLLVCLLSFMQWYIVGLIIDLTRMRLNPGHAYDTH
jgi:hypothetical protein